MPCVMGDHDVADFLKFLVDDLVSPGCVLRVEWVPALSEQPDPAHVVGLGPQAEDVAPDVGIRFRNRVFKLLERDAVMTQLPRIDKHLILLHGAAKPGHIDHTRHGLELPFEHPILDRLELVESVTRAFQNIADDLARGAPGR